MKTQYIWPFRWLGVFGTNVPNTLKNDWVHQYGFCKYIFGPDTQSIGGFWAEPEVPREIFGKAATAAKAQLQTNHNLLTQTYLNKDSLQWW